MNQSAVISLVWASLLLLLHLIFVVRSILRPHRQPASRIAWVVVILVMPLVGIVAYLLLGETNIGRKRVTRMREVLAWLPDPIEPLGLSAAMLQPEIPDRYQSLFTVGRSINGYRPLGENQAKLMDDSRSAIARMVADIDAAHDHVHVNFYIWLPDESGLTVAAALRRAAARGVTCRAMADSLGSRLLMASEHWEELRRSGVRIAAALPIGNPVLRTLKGRIDLRNHRKVVVIDNRITYCGSQNCADPEFRIKAKYAPWVDLMVRFEGPIARQNQHLFASDWMAQVNEDLSDFLQRPWVPAPDPDASSLSLAPNATPSLETLSTRASSDNEAADRSDFRMTNANAASASDVSATHPAISSSPPSATRVSANASNAINRSSDSATTNSSKALSPIDASALTGIVAQVIGTGPTVRYSAMPEVFETLMYAARRELCITTPYYVPDESMQAALCASARRGVATTLILPARNDSWVVRAASRSYYKELLDAGVRLYEYHGGLLHTKSLTLDGDVALIGSANLDRRSFELNYENNILLYHPQLTRELRQRQDEYLSRSTPVTIEIVEQWKLRGQFWNNTIAMLGPVL